MQDWADAAGTTEAHFQADFQQAVVDWLTAVAPAYTDYQTAIATADADSDNSGPDKGVRLRLARWAVCGRTSSWPAATLLMVLRQL